MFTSNFSDRFKKAMSGFQKAHDEPVAKLAKAANQVDSTLELLKPFVSTQ